MRASIWRWYRRRSGWRRQKMTDGIRQERRRNTKEMDTVAFNTIGT